MDESELVLVCRVFALLPAQISQRVSLDNVTRLVVSWETRQTASETNDEECVNHVHFVLFCDGFLQCIRRCVEEMR